MENVPIGVFDSGVGGLTVLKELAEQFPQENFIYLGDTARLPYGTKSPETIRKYSEQILNCLMKFKVKALVVACNSASSQIQESHWKSIPIYNVIQPSAHSAALNSKNLNIGVLGTRATIESHVFENALKQINPKINIFTQACPLFVPLAEEGLFNDPITDLTVKKYLNELLTHNIDTLILGCTHYPLLKPSINKFVGERIKLIESGNALALMMKDDFQNGKIKKCINKKGSISLIFTDLSNHIEELARNILNKLNITSIEKIDLNN